MRKMVHERTMRPSDIARLAWAGLRRSRTRTFLTTLGVVVGTACITLMLSIGWSGYSELSARIASSDSLTLIEVWPDPASSAQITAQAVAAFSALEHVEAASPVLEFPASLEAGRHEAVSFVRGVDPGVLRLRLAEGHMFAAGESGIELVLGDGVLRDFADPERPPDFSDGTTYQDYHPDVDWAGESVRLRPGYSGMDASVRTYRARVIGVTSPWEDGDMNPYVYLPLTAAERILRENRTAASEMGIQAELAGMAYVRTKGMEYTEEVMEQIIRMGYRVQSEISYVRAMNEEQSRQQTQLLAIGLISLAVSASGIANTMYASVLERRRDIGVMKVLGTSPREIRTLYLTEAAIIGLGGGLIGLAVSVVVVFFLNAGAGAGSLFGIRVESSTGIRVPLHVALFALGVAAATAVLAGIYPAWKATAMRPLEAIRSHT